MYVYISVYIYIYKYVRWSIHDTDSMVISLGGIAPQGSLSLHTVGSSLFAKNNTCIHDKYIYTYMYVLMQI